MNIAQSLQRAQTLGLARIDAQLLHLTALGRDPHDRAWLLAHDSDALPEDVAQRLDDWLRRRLAGEPIAYITGFKAFFGLNLQVDERVLDPRPDTEILVEWALELLPPNTPHRVLDLGTGSGAVALALQHQRPACAVTAVDASADALAVASANAQRLQLPVQCVQSHWMDELPGPFELIVSNPPYVADGDPHLSALTHEPLSALTSGADGLDDIRLIIAQAPSRLCHGGWLLLEHGWDQAPAVQALLREAGFVQVQSRRDLGGIERCTGGFSESEG
ncbi:peptide chain release factor N(5)-glutamine methyltransferase [Limnohabitans lacus]|jgi:release factor glutamine methyltransferase|uniref:Release factor glutamine methyltransferase n=1 Tax=Limnohabitans lacus TaxID=3045173 RepID=A0ABT6X7T9_9BURK|nr:peptide chain release factor N(5)-glutamine methyltransferase [Limnohabitans sp. HM2-2]MDI9234165.1 peptide chain release factor N(5)-glutamine methyltransferase [Limnohabitans sp. HM2-2]